MRFRSRVVANLFGADAPLALVQALPAKTPKYLRLCDPPRPSLVLSLLFSSFLPKLAIQLWDANIATMPWRLRSHPQLT